MKTSHNTLKENKNVPTCVQCYRKIFNLECHDPKCTSIQYTMRQIPTCLECLEKIINNKCHKSNCLQKNKQILKDY